MSIENENKALSFLHPFPKIDFFVLSSLTSGIISKKSFIFISANIDLSKYSAQNK